MLVHVPIVKLRAGLCKLAPTVPKHERGAVWESGLPGTVTQTPRTIRVQLFRAHQEQLDLLVVLLKKDGCGGWI